MTTVTEKNITINDFNRICRTCLSTKDLHTIYGVINSDFSSIKFILNKYTEVKVKLVPSHNIFIYIISGIFFTAGLPR